MRILASDEVRTFVREHGGRLYVWTSDHRCCTGRLTFLAAETTRPPGWKGRSEPVDAGGFELFLDAGVHGVPDELVLDLKGRKRRISAFWNGCAYIV
jgi:hypothetical protein